MPTDVFISTSPDETAKIARKFARRCLPGTVIALYGDLGAGKTVFAKGFALGLGIESPVTSPTFTIVQEYEIPSVIEKNQKGKLYHIDLYRIESAADASVFGIEEFFCDPSSMTLIEWAERLGNKLPPETIHVRIEPNDEGEESDRKITFDIPSCFFKPQD
ncbi:MAG TPA: tRNA (adenosine(37)-N6)-threonylcarbamoyltransferase complex ATPase subunit type 1 TsaE [Victivallales bacterium]|nr:tRNA (adenosine(37)-N6)-threonylcarbamoyltransferase complex ATPase subunit type 1 TsaE [Victivallales bacterium]